MVEAPTKWTTMFLQILFIICSVSNTYGVASTASPSCPRDEYRVGQVCCRACGAGSRVYKHCTAGIQTKCYQCTKGTFQEGSNGQKQCVSTCTKCDAGLGLKVKKSCTSTSDALCEPLDGYFCNDSNGGGCRAAERHHLSCSPGQYMGQRGTADEPPECLQCTDGTFSDGKSSCKPHSMCDFPGLMQIKPGTDSTDSTCIHHYWIWIIMGSLVLIISLGFLCRGNIMEIWRMRRELFEWRDRRQKEQQRKSDELVSRRHEKKKKARERQTEKDAMMRKSLLPCSAPGEGTSDPPSSSLLSPKFPAHLATSSTTSSTQATSGATQPAAETTPLTSSDGPAPTRGRPEHNITIHAVTMDGHDDDQSGSTHRHPDDSPPVLIRGDIDASQSIPSTSQSACRSGAGLLDIEMGPVPTPL